MFHAHYIPGVISRAENKRLLLRIRGPLSLVVELCRVPDNFEHDLRNLHWVGRGAVAADAGSGKESWPVLGIRDVRLVVRAVEVYAVPARRVKYVRADTTRTWARREALSVQPIQISRGMEKRTVHSLSILARSGIVTPEVLRSVAPETGLRLQAFGLTVHCIAEEHSETLGFCEMVSLRLKIETYGLESGNLALAGRDVVNDKTTLCLSGVLIVEEISWETVRRRIMMCKQR